MRHRVASERWDLIEEAYFQLVEEAGNASKFLEEVGNAGGIKQWVLSNKDAKEDLQEYDFALSNLNDRFDTLYTRLARMIDQLEQEGAYYDEEV
jgi:DNA repair ATPase RecN